MRSPSPDRLARPASPMRRELLTLGVGVILLLAIGVSGCQFSGPNLVVTPVPTSTPIPPPPPIPHKTITFCDDETGSYSPAYFQGASAQVATWVAALPQSNTNGATVYATWIKSNSYADDATYGRWDVPAVPYDPPAPTPVATAPAMEVEQQQTATAEETANAVAYTQAHASYQTALKQAQTAASAAGSAIQGMPRYNADSSDIWGCMQRATERYGQAPTDTKYLIIASDMDPVGPQEHAVVNLTNVKIAVIFFETVDVNDYNNRVNYWTQQLTQVGASGVSFFRPSDQLPAQFFD